MLGVKLYQICFYVTLHNVRNPKKTGTGLRKAGSETSVAEWMWMWKRLSCGCRVAVVELFFVCGDRAESGRAQRHLSSGRHSVVGLVTDC